MSLSYDFSGQTALVPGAATGMGRAAALLYAEAGASVALLDVNVDEVSALAEELKAGGGDALALQCDVRDEAQVAEAVQQTVARWGKLDMAYNNAGVQAPPIEMHEQSAEAYDRVMDINLRGIWASTKHEVVQMRKQGHGSIVNCASIGGLIGGQLLGAYHASKHGVIGLTKSAALENAAHGIRINAVCPGTIDTPMVAEMKNNQPENIERLMQRQVIGRLGRPEEVAAAVIWLSSTAASFCVGSVLAVDGGFTAH